ncbi:MAG: hydroxymyristoyl-ACP dehydratase [Bacteroidales bacterium]|nr:hydroxymyristoyl-ACP dehydratase [Bacteroidales bacterium]
MKTNLKFLNDLYVIKDIQEDSQGGRVIIQTEINPDHALFGGHFPGSPVLPGVCTIQIMKELLIFHLGTRLELRKAGTIKYLSFINPEVNRLINFDLQVKETEEGQLAVSATVFYGTTVFCSFKGEWGKTERE